IKSYLGVFLLILSLLSSKISLFLIPPLIILLVLQQKYFHNLLKVKRSVLITVLTFFAIILLLIIKTPAGWQSIKENDLSLFYKSDFLANVNLLRGQEREKGNKYLGTIFFNKSYYLTKIVENFLSYINPSFLFTRGDSQSLQNPSNFGPILLIFFPFTVIGLILAWQNFSIGVLFIFILLLVSTLPGVFLSMAPQTNRFLPGLFAISIFSSFSLIKVKRAWLKILLVLLITLNFSLVVFDILAKEKNRSYLTWQEENYQIAEFIKKNPDKKIWVSDSNRPNPGPTITYYLNVPFNQTNLSRKRSDFYRAWLNQFNNVTIGDLKDVRLAKDKWFKYLEEKQKLSNLEVVKHPFDIYVVDKKEEKYFLKNKLIEKKDNQDRGEFSILEVVYAD
ncbi:hypothetical protein HYS93_01810, partial [Candidatus Daviesbacteria bacterium]|nr:hypothetical protein [Candidatus Daviesbacteria bacterium]